VRPSVETVAELRRTYDGFLVASRISTSDELKDSIIGQIAVIDALRHRAPSQSMSRDMMMLMARHAEAVSWLYEESFDAASSLYWLDRAAFWSQTVEWRDMVAFTFYRRSLLAMNYTDDGRQVLWFATNAAEMPGILPSVKGAALEKVSRGYAMLGDRDASARAMDLAVPHLSRIVDHPENPALDAQSVATDDSLAFRRSASLLALGMGAEPISILEPRLASIGDGYQRNHNMSSAMLALGYANAGQPDRACSIAAATAEALKETPSVTTWQELRRTARVLNAHWPNREDVRDICALMNADRPSRQ
jgi:hypothetical protein